MSLVTGAHCTITVDSDWSTNGRNEDICALVSGLGERLRMRSYRASRCGAPRSLATGRLTSSASSTSPSDQAPGSRAVAWAPGLGKDEIFVTAQGEKFESSLFGGSTQRRSGRNGDRSDDGRNESGQPELLPAL